MFISAVSFAADDASISIADTSIAQQHEQALASLQSPGLITLYKPTYILPFYHTNSPYKEIYEGQTPLDQAIDHNELKAQLSFMIPFYYWDVWQRPLSINAAYTQLMYWQVYAKSQFFRETNYEPEIFLQYIESPYMAYQLGLNHESNGRGGLLERSWNRAFSQVSFSGSSWLLNIKGWFLIFTDGSSDVHNPDIAHFLGYDNWVFSWDVSKVTASVEVQNAFSGLRRGYQRVTLSYPLLKHIRIYGEIFNGYGQSLIEYNNRTTSAGIGISLNDWHR